MIGSAAALVAALASAVAAAPTASDAPLRVHLLAVTAAAEEAEAQVLYALEDAPTTPGQAFGASLLTSATGLTVLVGLNAAPIVDGQPMTNVAFISRLAAGLLLLSVGPSMGDLLNDDLGAFLTGAGGRTAMAAAGFGAVFLAATSPDPLLVASSILVVTLGALVWTGWGAADLVRSAFAPERWVERQNAPLRRFRQAPPPPLRN